MIPRTYCTVRALRSCVVTAFVLLLAVAMTGCMRVDRALQVNSDGSGTYTLPTDLPLSGLHAASAGRC